VGGIFISYRREDAAPWAGRLYERLAREFPRNQLFIDVDAIEPGLDFAHVLEQQVSACDVLLAIIGSGWVEARNKEGLRRLDDPKDFIRIELDAALKRDIRVIPVLIDGAMMPSEDELPGPLKPIVRRNAVQVSHVSFGADTQRLVEVLKRLVTQPARASLTGLFGIIVASAFALASLPIAIAMVILFRKMQWTFSPSDLGQSLLGLLTGAVLTVVSALATAHWRGAALSGAEIALYWIGSAIPIGFTVGFLSHSIKWSWFSQNDNDHIFASAWLTATLLTVVSALAMADQRREKLTGAEIALYWLGSVIPIAITSEILFYVMNWTWFGQSEYDRSVWGLLAGVVLAAVSGVTLLLLWRRRSAT
jgi:hypothetical protein